MSLFTFCKSIPEPILKVLCLYKKTNIFDSAKNENLAKDGI